MLLPTRSSLALTVLTLSACSGLVESGPRGPRGAPASRMPDLSVREPTSAIPRLSVRELDATLEDVFGIEGAAARHLPPDPATAINTSTRAEDEVFDTELSTKSPSQVFVEGLAALAFEVAGDVAADPSRLGAVEVCAGQARPDDACLGSFSRALALRLWHRPLELDEESALLARAAPFIEEGGFALGARLVIQSLVQSPELAYRVEIGADAGEGLRRLSGWELLARTSYFLWGSAPSPALLARLEESGGAIEDEMLEALAREMAGDPRAEQQMRRFHRMWLRYDRMLVGDSALAADMLVESDALVDRALFEDGAEWRDLFISTQTFVTPALAAHYGLGPRPATPSWLAYDDTQRAGLLSHGSFLSLSSTRMIDTLPSRRGAMIARRLLCIPILPPPPDVDIDNGVEVPPGACKAEAYEAHRSRGSCAGCHSVIDGIGFGLERFDGLGRYRTVETENPTCAIEGVGQFRTESFSSPRELVAIADGSGDLARCGVEQVVRFAHRRVTASSDRALIERLSRRFEDSGQDFRELMIAVVLDPAFRFRREEAP